MMMTKGQRRRALRHATIPWADEVADPRDARGRIHSHHGVLSLLVAAFACGRNTFRRAEDLGEDLGRVTRRALGLPRKVSDTTLYRVVEGQSPLGFRQTVREQVKQALRCKDVQNDLLAVGVMAFDGKGNWSSTSHEVEGAKASSCGSTGDPFWSLGSLRAVWVSSGAKPCVDVEMIGAKEGESPAFREMFPRVSNAFGGKFEIATWDAGLTCRENAELVRAHGKHYVAALKGNQPSVYAVATEASWGPVRATTDQRCQGKTVVRDLFKLTVKDDLRVDFKDAQQLWCVQQTSLTPDGKSAVELRFFITSLPAGYLTASQELAVVRLHWGIENGHNWTMDMMLEEDDVQPCQASKDSIEVVCWLRVLAYNLISIWRSKAGKKDNKPMPWARVMEKLRDFFLSAVDATPEGLPTLG